MKYQEEALIRITSGSHSDTSDEVFSLASIVGGVSAEQVCETTATISWVALTGAEEYDLYMLGGRVYGNCRNYY